MNEQKYQTDNLSIKDILSMNMSEFLKIVQLSPRLFAIGFPQPCDVEFEVSGEGSGDDKISALRSAADDAQSTAKAICIDSTCGISTAVPVRIVTAKATGSGNNYTANGKYIYKCSKST